MLKPLIDVRYADGHWKARSDDPLQGSVGGSGEVVLRTVGDWIGVELPGRHPRVAGRCPACGSSSLFLGSGGHVTCGLVSTWGGSKGCPDPTMADRYLHGEEGSK